MRREIRDADDLKKALDLEESYMIGITLCDKLTGLLNHYILTKDFNKVDMLASNGKIKELVVENLSKGDTVIPEF